MSVTSSGLLCRMQFCEDTISCFFFLFKWIGINLITSSLKSEFLDLSQTK